MRILVTGSRDYDDPGQVRRSLQLAAESARASLVHSGKRFGARRLGHDVPITLVHGDCPTGADSFAKTWAEDVNTLHGHERITIEPHPADWNRECDENCHHRPRRPGDRCPAAGPIRNREMVDLGADICLAFPLDSNTKTGGTAGTIRMASEAGIFTLVHRRPDELKGLFNE